MRDHNNPSFFEAIAADPHLPLTKSERAIYIRDMNRKKPRLFLPFFRALIVPCIWIVRFIKRYLPFDIGSHRALNHLGVWFMRNLLSPQALSYVIRHFQIESALINFVAKNSGSDMVKQVDLFPTKVEQLGDADGVNAIVLHDLNIFNHIIDTGADNVHLGADQQLPYSEIDFSSLSLPPVEADDRRKRLLSLDIETACYVMVFFLVLFLTDKEGERAALSLQLDQSLMTSLANLTGDDFYRTLCPMRFTQYTRYHINVVQDLRFHMMTLDFAFYRLTQLHEKQQKNE